MLKFLNPKVTKLYGYDEMHKSVFKVISSHRTDTNEIYAALAPRYQSRCTHDYDCCGCPVYSYTVRQDSPRAFTVHVNAGRNY
jgi:hypothetical protein